jgi:hypothetical protein
MKTREMSPLERFRKKNKRDYLFNIQRSMTMLIKMSELNVHAAFIGQDNLREYIFNPDLLQKYGHEVLVEVPVNFKEAEKAVKEISLSFHRSTNHSKQEFNRLKKTIPPLKYELFRPEKIPKAWASMIRTDMANMTLIQRYKSIINNYTVESSEKQPDYIGSWSMQSWRVPAEGFFELFITEQQGSDVKGIIKDAYGDATFTGTLVENPLNKWHGFKFKKIYDKKAHKDTRGQILLYDGAGSDDWFIGHYVLETKKPLAQIEGAGPPGEFFEMEKYRPGKSQIIINAEDGKEMERELIRQNKSPL